MNELERIVEVQRLMADIETRSYNARLKDIETIGKGLVHPSTTLLDPIQGSLF